MLVVAAIVLALSPAIWLAVGLWRANRFINDVAGDE